jgi:hypothetical protein
MNKYELESKEKITIDIEKLERNLNEVAHITFVDKQPVTEVEVSRNEVEVNEGDFVDRPDDPSKRGYDFDC